MAQAATKEGNHTFGLRISPDPARYIFRPDSPIDHLANHVAVLRPRSATRHGLQGSCAV